MVEGMKITNAIWVAAYHCFTRPSDHHQHQVAHHLPPLQQACFPQAAQDLCRLRLPSCQDPFLRVGTEGQAQKDHRYRTHALPQGRSKARQERLQDWNCHQEDRRRLGIKLETTHSKLKKARIYPLFFHSCPT